MEPLLDQNDDVVLLAIEAGEERSRDPFSDGLAPIFGQDLRWLLGIIDDDKIPSAPRQLTQYRRRES